MSSSRPTAEQLVEMRQALATHLQWSPLDYIPNINRAADRELYAAELTRKLPESADLRSLERLADGTPLAVIAERLAWDSDFFGYGVARLDGMFPLTAPPDPRDMDYAPLVARLLERARQQQIRYLFATVDPRDMALMRALGQLGFSLLETRLHYHFGLQIVHYLRLPDHLPNGWVRFRTAREEDIPSLAEVVVSAANPYDRFHGDPFIPRADVDRLMTRWVEESVRGRFADLTIVPDVSEPRAFITYRYHKDKWERWGVNLVQAVLSAVAPEFFGWFAVIGPDVASYLSRNGAHSCFGKTQITLGLDATARFGKGEHIFRILL